MAHSKNITRWSLPYNETQIHQQFQTQLVLSQFYTIVRYFISKLNKNLLKWRLLWLTRKFPILDQTWLKKEF